MKSPSAQAAEVVVMVRPRDFGFNPETAVSNELQVQPAGVTAETLAEVHREFDGVVLRLESAGVEVLTFDSPRGRMTPDAVFPNNWFSTHADGTVVLYPMLAVNRRAERQPELIESLSREHGFHIERTIDLTALEAQQQYVEGTGSLVLDRIHRIAYAALSPRTTLVAAGRAAEVLGYRLHSFVATHASGGAIYHTNVLLSVGTAMAIGCFDAIREPKDRHALLEEFERTGKRPIQLSEAQMMNFAANVLELRGKSGPVLVISTRAWNALDPIQRGALEAQLQICAVPIETIERIGGGGVRCMLAEIHLPRL